MRRLPEATAACTAMLASLALIACSPAIELADHVADAGAFTATAEIDFGGDGGRAHLLGGWSRADERWAGRADETFVWGLADGSVVEAWLMDIIDRTVTLRLRPNAPDGVPVVGSLWVTFNGGPLPPIAVEAGWQEIELEVPERFQVLGPNRIAFGYDKPPGEPASQARPGTYRLAFDWLRLSGVTVTALPRRSLASASEILLPHLSALDFRLELRPGAILRLGLVREYGRPLDDAPHLLVRLETPSGVETIDVPTRDDRFVEPAAIPVPLQEPGEVRISLICLPPTSFELLRGHEAEQDAGCGLLGAQVRDRS